MEQFNFMEVFFYGITGTMDEIYEIEGRRSKEMARRMVAFLLLER